MKLDYILVSLAVAGLSEAAPIKRGFLDDLFGISSTTSTPIVAAAPVTTAPVAAPAAAAVLTTPVAQAPIAAAAAVPTTTISSSSSVGFWGRLFGGGRFTTTSATQPTTTAGSAPAVTAQAVQTTPAVAATPTSTTRSVGLIGGLLEDFFGADSRRSSSAAAAAAAAAQATTTTPAATRVQAVPAVATSVTPVATAAPAAAVTTTSSGNLFDYLFGGSRSTSSAVAALGAASSQPTTSLLATSTAGSIGGSAGSGTAGGIHGGGPAAPQESGYNGNLNSGTPTTTGSTLGKTFQGGGTATTSVNEATVTVSGSAEGAKAAEGAFGITYSPYTDQDACKSAQEVAKDIKLLSSYSVIRLYGTDCSGIENVMSAMTSSQKIYIGVWNIESPDGELQDIVSAVSSSSRGWSAVHTIAIGNERVNAGEATVDQVKTAVDTSRLYLTANGYTGPIVTVDTLVAYVANPQLCEISDYLAVNCHPYWDGGVEPSNSGPWLLQQIALLQSVCGTSKKVLITESGWPTQGEAYGTCVPSVKNQVAAVSSIVSSLADQVIMFTMYNDYWKFSIGGAGPYGVEYYWGLYGNSPE
ncbi:Cell surface mannoprotein MP65 [Candida viswanathii]|uniref:Cell surface mannoprotein MP65 n=1 Tax=Candida viswanathii TaxID=5486 RepID=A0A367XSU1_9ASCO|nr:Cell surface mannoprotein MP65 [Candida viswanathii]